MKITKKTLAILAVAIMNYCVIIGLYDSYWYGGGPFGTMLYYSYYNSPMFTIIMLTLGFDVFFLMVCEIIYTFTNRKR